ncbi:MAG: hypothetical protein GXX85_15560 [Ignavibacteria bacterium]|nr:hypothetical protein [Ignavibacteria bacterium]
MKKVLLLIILFLSIQMYYAQNDLSTELELAYKNDSSERLDWFLMNWHLKSSPISSEQFQKLSDTVIAVYEIYEKFYNPFELDKIKGSEYGNHYYNPIDYIIISPTINVRFVDKFLNYLWMDSLSYKKNLLCEFSIDNFAPRLHFPYHKVLYLTSDYDSVITKFLKNEQSPFGAEGIMNTAQPIGESKKRVEFLRPKIKIISGHWGGYWHLTTHPDIRMIELNSSLDTARVRFRLVYQFGEAMFKKSNGEWSLVYSKITGQE